MIPRAALAYIKWILPLTNKPVSTVNISCADLTKDIFSVLQTQNKTDALLPNLACIASLSGALLYSPSFHPALISFYVFNMPKNSKTVRRNPKKICIKISTKINAPFRKNPAKKFHPAINHAY